MLRVPQELRRLPLYWQQRNESSSSSSETLRIPVWAAVFFSNFAWDLPRLEAFLDSALHGLHDTEPDIVQCDEDMSALLLGSGSAPVAEDVVEVSMPTDLALEVRLEQTVPEPGSDVTLDVDSHVSLPPLIVDDSVPTKFYDMTMTRYSADYNHGVAAWSEPESDGNSSHDDASPHAEDVRPRPQRWQERLHVAALQRHRKRACKYGMCPTHHRGRYVTVAYGGRHAGKVVLRCPKFREVDHQNKRGCWHQQPYFGSLDQLPKQVLGDMKRLRGDLRWNLRHGPQTRAE